MARGAKDEARQRRIVTSLRHMESNIPLNGVPGWQKKRVAIAHAEHWPYGTLDFSQPSGGQFSFATSTYVAHSSFREEPSAPTEQTPASSPTHDDVPLLASRHTRATRPRRGAARRRIASPTQGTSNALTRRRRPSSDAAAPTSGVPYTGIPQQLHQQPEIQTYYTLPPGINADIIPRSFVPRSMGTFESSDYAPHPSLVDRTLVAGRHSDESSVSSHSTSPSEILSASDFQQQLLYPDTTYNYFMLSPSSSTQGQGSTSSSSLSTDSSPYEPHCNQTRNDYDFRTRVNSQSSFTHPVAQAANPSAGIHQGVITGNNQAFYFAERQHLSYHSSSASTSSPLETLFSPTSYVSSGSVTHRLEDEGLEVQAYAGDMELQHFTAAHNSFPPYALPGGTGADETFNPYHYDTTHRK